MNNSSFNKIIGTPIDFNLVFESMPVYSVLLDIDAPRFTIVAVTDEYLVLSNKKRASIMGKGLFEVFPPNPAETNFTGENNLSHSFNTVINTKEPHQLPVQRYDIADKAGNFSKYHWRATNKPVLDKEGNILYILHTAQNITDTIEAQQQEQKIKGIEQAHNLLMLAPDAIAIIRGPGLEIELANDHIKNIWGKGNDIVGKLLPEVLPELLNQGLFQIMNEVIKTGTPYHGYEMPISLIRDGEKHLDYFTFIYQPYYEADKTKPVGLMIFASDVSDKVLTRKGLEESEARFAQITNTLPLVVWTASPNGDLTYISNQWQEEYGNPVNESLGTGWAKFVHPDDVEQAANTWASVLKSGAPYETEFRVQHKNGNYHWLLVRALPLRNSDGEIKSWYGTNIDIQDKKVTEEITNYRKTLLEAHNNASMDGILLVDAKGRIISYNQKFIEVWDMPFEIVQANDDEAALSYAMSQLVNPERFVEKVKYPYDHPTETSLDELEFIDGRIVERYGYPVVGNDGTYYAWSWIFKDITQHKLNEKAINESELRFRSLANSISQLAWMTDAEGWIYWYNQRWYDYTGTTLEQMQGWGWQQVLHPDLAEGVIKRFKNAIETGTNWEDTFLLRSKGGELRWFLSRALPIRNNAGDIVQWFGTNTDISDQRKIEEELKESEERFRSLAEALPQLVWVTDEKGQSEFTSKRWEDFTGVKHAGLKVWEAIVHPDDIENINKAWLHSLTSGDLYKTEVRLKSKTGGYIWHAVVGEPVYDNENKITKWVGAFTDIHHIKEQEQRRVEFTKIVSHELKTPVTSIKGYVQVLLMMLKGEQETALPAQIKSSLLRIEKLVTRITRLITEMLDLSRIEAERLDLQNEEININTLVNEAVEDIRHSNTSHSIQILTDFNCTVYGDKNRLEQVIINLVTNAIKYSSEEYKIEIKIYKEQNNQVAVSIKDNGIGIDKKDHEKIFERFYRVEGAIEQTYTGFGIGLFIVKAIIERHSGSILVESEKGKGATFTFLLPVYKIINHTTAKI